MVPWFVIGCRLLPLVSIFNQIRRLLQHCHLTVGTCNYNCLQHLFGRYSIELQHIYNIYAVQHIFCNIIYAIL